MNTVNVYNLGIYEMKKSIIDFVLGEASGLKNKFKYTGVCYRHTRFIDS